MIPADFIAQFSAALSFTGPFAQAAPWQRHVILHGGKFYASNNRQIIEINCGVEGSAILTKKMLSLVKTIGVAPTTIEIGEWVRFGWKNGRYLKVKNDYDHDDVVTQLTDLLDEWHGTVHVETIDLPDGRGIEVAEGPPVVDGVLPPRKGFFHLGKKTPTSRLVNGDAGLRLDDLFQIKLKELDATKMALERERERLEDKRERIERLQAANKKALADHERELARVNDAIARYRRGDELDDSDKERLSPACEKAIRHEEAVERRETLQEVQKELPGKIQDWDRYSETSDGEYAYVTFRRRLAPMETRPKIKKRIANIVDQVFAPDFPREVLFKAWPSLGSIEPRAGPS